MSARKREPIDAWRDTPEGISGYHSARDEAQRLANETGYDFGLEANDVFKTWCHFVLPARQFRQGFELRCEVVSPEDLSITHAGHGYRL